MHHAFTHQRLATNLLALVALSLSAANLHAQVGSGNLVLHIDNAYAANSQATNPASPASVTVNTTLSANVSVGGVGNGESASVTCYDGGTVLASGNFSSQGSYLPFSWTGSTVGTHNVFCSAYYSGYASGNVSTGYVPISVTYPSVQGYVNPKYLVVGVTYAPPGPSSYVQYTNSTALSNTSSVSQTISTTVSQSISVGSKAGIPGVFGAKVTASSSTSYTQSSGSSNSVTINQMSQRSYKVNGPSNPYAPVNHDYDIIWVWLNPVALFTVTTQGPSQVTWNGYGFDTADQPDLDIYPMQAGLLNGHLGPNPYGTQLSRSWATNQNYGPNAGPGLTANDINNILSADPYTSSAGPYTFTLDLSTNPVTTTDGRFTLSSAGGGSTSDFVYIQPAAGSQPITQTLTNSYSTMSTAAQNMSNTFSQGFGVDVNFAASPFITSFDLDIRTNYNFTVTNAASSAISQTSGNIDAVSITGPPCNATTAPCVPTYSKPTEFNIYQDNIYGTFLFYPVR